MFYLPLAVALSLGVQDNASVGSADQKRENMESQVIRTPSGESIMSRLDTLGRRGQDIAFEHFMDNISHYRTVAFLDACGSENLASILRENSPSMADALEAELSPDRDNEAEAGVVLKSAETLRFGLGFGFFMAMNEMVSNDDYDLDPICDAARAHGLELLEEEQ